MFSILAGGPEASPGSKAVLEDTKPGQQCAVSAAAANFMITSIGAMTAAVGGLKPREGTDHVPVAQYSSPERNPDERSEPSNPEERPVPYASPAPSVSPANFQNYPGFIVANNEAATPMSVVPDESPARSMAQQEYAFTPVNYAPAMSLSGYHSAPNFSTDAVCDPFAATPFACGRGTVVSPTTPRKPMAVSSLKKQQPKSRSSAGKTQN
jgi:hypothetical protein